MATVSGLIQIGIRILWITLFKIRKHGTAPQGLLVTAILLTLSLLALNYTVTTTVAPGYAHFGSQVYVSDVLYRKLKSFFFLKIIIQVRVIFLFFFVLRMCEKKKTE